MSSLDKQGDWSTPRPYDLAMTLIRLIPAHDFGGKLEDGWTQALLMIIV